MATTSYNVVTNHELFADYGQIFKICWQTDAPVVVCIGRFLNIMKVAEGAVRDAESIRTAQEGSTALWTPYVEPTLQQKELIAIVFGSGQKIRWSRFITLSFTKCDTIAYTILWFVTKNKLNHYFDIA